MVLKQDTRSETVLLLLKGKRMMKPMETIHF